MTDANPAQPLTAEAVQQQVRETMMAQQAHLLEIAGRNALKLLQDEQKKSAPSLLDTINGEMAAARAHDGHEWKNDINKSNFDALHQVEQLWSRTERYVDSLEVAQEQAPLKTGALETIQKGKNLVHERLKLLRSADRDGWKVALYYEGDNIAENESEAKRMRKSKKEADKQVSDKYKRDRDRKNFFTGRDGQGSSRDSRAPFYRNAGFGSPADQRYCFLCRRRGHLARSRECPRR